MAFSTINTATDGALSLAGLVTLPAGTFITGATVVGTLRTLAGAVVPNWNAITFADQTGGLYTVSFLGVNVPAPGTYSLVVTATNPATGLILTIQHDVIVQPLSA